MKGVKTNSYFLALIAMWTAVLLTSSFLIIYPVPGTPASITFSSVLLSSITAPLLGSFYGTISALIFGLLVPYINPATSIGILTFLPPTISALMSGFFLYDRWKEATLLFLVQIVIWFAHPFAWYKLMPLITWEYWVVLTFILVPSIRKWIQHSILSLDKKRLPIALWCLAWISRIGGDVATGNNIAVWILNWTGEGFYPFWAPMTLYYAIADSLNCVGGAIIGASVLLALNRSHIKTIAMQLYNLKMIFF